MKKLFFVIVISTVFAVLPLLAQEAQASNGNGSLYYVKVPILKIYPHSMGYVVTYQVGTYGTEVNTVYLPDEWFTPKESKGIVINMRSAMGAPNMTVYYRDGAFDHVKLYIRENRGDRSWGYMPLQTNLDDKFSDVTDVPLKFLAATDKKAESDQ